MTTHQNVPLNMGLRPLLRNLGLQAEPALRRAGLPENLWSRPEARLCTADYFRFWQGLEAQAGTPFFGLRMAQAASADAFDPPLFAALCSANLMQAVQRLAQYRQLVAPMALEIAVTRSGNLSLSPRWLLAPSDVPPSLQLAEIAFFVRLARLATRSTVHAVDVTLPTLPAARLAKRCETYFGVPVHLGAVARITFSASDAQRPFLLPDAGMWHVFAPALRKRMNQLDATATVTEQVKALLLELLPSKTATIDVAACRMNLSERTLQRHLADEGENFRTLVSGVREQLAHHYLANTSLPGADISFLLGFDNANSFYRAFQDWTGQTAGTVRKALLRRAA